MDEILDDDIGTLRWFGPSWGAPVNDPRAEIPTPEGETCPRCEVALKAGNRGISIPYYDGHTGTRLSYHLLCWMDEIGAPW